MPKRKVAPDEEPAAEPARRRSVRLQKPDNGEALTASTTTKPARGAKKNARKVSKPHLTACGHEGGPRPTELLPSLCSRRTSWPCPGSVPQAPDRNSDRLHRSSPRSRRSTRRRELSRASRRRNRPPLQRQRPRAVPSPAPRMELHPQPPIEPSAPTGKRPTGS
jgi:hypothetical protein